MLRTPALRWTRCITTLLLVLLLCGCAWMRARLLSPIPERGQHVVLLSSAPLAVVGGQHYSGPAQNQDYMLMRGSAGQAELIYIRAIGYQGQAAIKYHGYRLRQLTAGWGVNAGGIRNWGAAHALNTALARFHYVLYSAGQPDRDCAAFQALWDVPPGDAYRRPAKLIFGYYCAKPGMAFDETTLAQFLTRLRVGFVSGSNQQPTPLLPAQTEGKKTGYYPFPQLLPIFRPPLSDGQAATTPIR